MLSFDKLKPLAYRHIDGSYKRSKNEKVFYILIVIKGDTEMKKNNQCNCSASASSYRRNTWSIRCLPGTKEQGYTGK